MMNIKIKNCNFSLYLFFAYAAPIATLFTKQNPDETNSLFSTCPEKPEWFKGGQIKTNAFLTVLFITKSMAYKTHPVVLYIFS